MKPKLPPNKSKMATAKTSAIFKQVAVGTLALLGVLAFSWTAGESPALNYSNTSDRSLENSIDLNPDSDSSNDSSFAQALERRTIQGVEVFLQRPVGPAKGIFFAAHGCSHSATDWWPRSQICPNCIGLPEEQAIVNVVLAKYHFIVVVISSVDRDRKCWGPDDGPRVASVLKSLLQEEQEGTDKEEDSNLPVIAFGASSGGGFVGKYLPEAMPLTGFIAQIAAPPPPTTDSHPPPVAVYVSMNRDSRTDEAVQLNVQSLQSQNHPAKQIRLPPLRITPDFFSQRISTITLEQSKAMVSTLKSMDYLDSRQYMLQADPRRSNWRALLRPHIPPEQDSFVADASPVSEVLNVAWGKHELAREGVVQAIDFILQEQPTSSIQ